MSSDQDDVDRLLLDELEFLSKKISDLIYEQNFIDISVLNLKRIEIIKKIKAINFFFPMLVQPLHKCIDSTLFVFNNHLFKIESGNL